MNNEKKQAPRCPYCGAEMTLENNEDVLFGSFTDEEKMYWYQCNAPSCGIHSPACHTEAGAYKAAMKRHEEPNRVLTLEEVLKIANENNNWRNHVCWLERNSNYPICPGCIDALEDGYLTFYEVASEEFDRYTAKEYGIEWRCWLRMTTKEECEAVEWLPEKKEEGDDDE